MKIKLNTIQYEFLQDHLASERADLFKFFAENKNFVFEINEETAYEVRDWVSEKLQIEGFDSDYNLNDIGVILEQLQDRFYA